MDFSPLREMRKAFDNDKLDVFRKDLVQVIGEDGSMSEVMQDVPIYTQVPCHLTCASLDKKEGEIDVTPVDAVYKIACDAKIDIKKGDYVVAFKYGGNDLIGEFSGFLGEPALFSTRKEAVMGIRLNP